MRNLSGGRPSIIIPDKILIILQVKQDLHLFWLHLRGMLNITDSQIKDGNDYRQIYTLSTNILSINERMARFLFNLHFMKMIKDLL